MTCSVDGCDRTHYARDMCELHYRRWKRTGDVTRRTNSGACAVDGCGRPASSRGLCHGHYQRLRRNGDVAAEVPLGRRRQPETCTVDGCERRSNAQGMCRAHRNRLRARGDVVAEEPIRTPTGGGHLSHGYVKVAVPPELRHLTNGETSVTEHRVVMAQHLGRPLRPDEVVHHRNGDRTDNRIENLELWSTYQPKGQRVEDKVRYAVEILQRYASHHLRAGAAGADEDPTGTNRG